MEQFLTYLLHYGYTEGSANSAVNRAKAFRIWCKEEGISELQVDYKKMLEFIEHEKNRGLSQQSMQGYLLEIKHYYNYLRKEKLVELNPLDFIQIHGVPKRKLHNILSYEELKKLYQDYSYPKDKLKEARNKALLGLILFQGIRTVQIHKLSIHDLRLRTAKVHVPGSIKTNPRWIKLEAEQLLDLMVYRLDIRPKLLERSGRETDLLFFTEFSESDIAHNLKNQVIQGLKKANRKVQNSHQLRASIITHWLKTENLRKAQYKAGHRHIDSTEAYQINDLDGLKNELEGFFPI